MNVRQWIDGLAPRERRLVYAAGALGAIALLYVAVALPVDRLQARQAARVDKKAADLAWATSMCSSPIPTPRPTSRRCA